ncbi:MAG TPA: chalcone isomerase family protein [Burkholderiales bacterium]|nr:chalcone isomerase family protein [Burkholderiales bacterium]
MATRLRAALLVLLATCAIPSLAADVAGVTLAPSVQVSGTTLMLNGAGLRKRLFFKVYVAGLYVARTSAQALELISEPGPKRVAIHMLRDVGADTFTGALREGIEKNHSAAETAALEPRVEALAAVMKDVGETKDGMNISLDWIPGSGTVIVVDGTARGKPIAGEDFYQALLRIWIGEHPAQDDLKKALLGEKG